MPYSFYLPTGHLSEENFQIPHKDWNAARDQIWGNRPLRCGPGRAQNFFRHPWMAEAGWSPDMNCFVAVVNPGFVRGEDVEVAIPKWCASEKTLSRLGIRNAGSPRTDPVPVADKVPAYLSEDPAIPLYSDESQIAYGMSGDNESGVTIPEYFHYLGVPNPATVSVDDDLTLSWYQSDLYDADNRRLLRSIDITLAHEKPIISVGFVKGGVPYTPRAEAFVDWGAVSGRKPWLDIRGRTPVDLSDSIGLSAWDVLNGGIPQPTEDYLFLCRVWLLSPPGCQSDTVTAEWEAIPEHKVFWNVDYSVAPVAVEVESFFIVNPLAYLVSGLLLGQNIVDDLNRANDRVAERLSTTTISGRFWSV